MHSSQDGFSSISTPRFLLLQVVVVVVAVVVVVVVVVVVLLLLLLLYFCYCWCYCYCYCNSVLFYYIFIITNSLYKSQMKINSFYIL